MLSPSPWLTLLHWRADAKASEAFSPPLPVATTTIALEHGHVVEQRLAGRREPRQETPVAFERGGLVTELLVEEGDLMTNGQVIAVLNQGALPARWDGLLANRQRRQAELEQAMLTTELRPASAIEAFPLFSLMAKAA